jgi:ABC-type transport system involved in multi-copper enzyme maturation permease subunit
MTFLSLLTKELRLRMRRERTIWIIVTYILLMGLLGWLSINSYSPGSGASYNNSALSNVGLTLYYLLSQLQLFLIIFITPAFTATAVNGEKERQTFDLLLCSRLSAFSLLSGKLLAGLTNALLLIAASAPLFSLVFFFGGVGPIQIVKALIVFILTTMLSGTFGLFCSTIFKRPAVSTAVSYMACLIWIGLPVVTKILMLSSPTAHPAWFVYGNVATRPILTTSYQLPFWLAINPITALINTYPNGGMSYAGFYNPLLSLTASFYPGSIYNPNMNLGMFAFVLLGLKLTAWKGYAILSILGTIIFFSISVWLVKPHTYNRFQSLIKKEKAKVKTETPETSETPETPVTA